MTTERSKRRDFLSLILITKSFSKKLLTKTEKAKENNKTPFRRFEPDPFDSETSTTPVDYRGSA